MILRDFYCDGCQISFEDYTKRPQELVLCRECGLTCSSVLSAPRLGLYNDPQKRSEVLRKRSHEHTMNGLKKEPERFGFQSAKYSGWNVRNKH